MTDTKAGTRVRGRACPLPNDFPANPTGFPFTDPYDFMRGKRVDDGIPSHLWRIHDDLYDLKGFKHPGGAHWLSLTRGTDITELFESHHINPAVHAMLPAFRVQRKAGDPPLPPRRSPFTFKEDGFYVTLRKKIWAAHGGEKRKSGASKVAAIGPSFQSKAFADAWAVLSVMCTVATGCMTSMTKGLMAAIGSGVVNGLFVGIGHNFLHQADNFRRLYQDLSGFSSPHFRMHHALSHHPYTNTVLDAEINALGTLAPGMLFPVGKLSRMEAAKRRIILALACVFNVPANNLRRFAQVLTGSLPNETAGEQVAHLLPFAQLAALSWLQGSVRKGSALWMAMLTATSSLFLMGNFLTGPHFNNECWHQGDTLDSTDWGMMQVQTNTERTDLPRDDFVNIAAFGLHHLHHLFPTVDAFELSKLVPLFRTHCEEWGVTFSTMTNRQLAAGLDKCIAGYEPNDRTRNGMYTRSKL